ncbi:membrane protein [Rufibacter sp. DG15C]|uniref:OmpH family outer membrane protein n=1 Tax=Rufibacter sp. DG15C TaxID=1379909 RepID=UPI00078C8645|nr:OmpH family outer membrane protein [Rufibacter sp. DG15C]AMM51091.1 membrane protein [Rufibacter sp. DG15C]
MKRTLGFLLVVTLFLVSSQTSHAQRFGYIDSEFILQKMPAYSNAQAEVDKLSAAWQKEIENMRAEVEKLKKAYQAEEILLTSEMKTKRLEEITKKENEVREYQRKMFGFEGSLFKKREEMIRPAQDQLFEAVEKVVRQKGLSFIFDKSSRDVVMLYTDPRHDYTEYVLEELGLASKEANSQGARPADALIDKPEDIPPLPEAATENSPSKNTKPASGTKKPPVKKKNN